MLSHPKSLVIVLCCFSGTPNIQAWASGLPRAAPVSSLSLCFAQLFFFVTVSAFLDFVVFQLPSRTRFGHHALSFLELALFICSFVCVCRVLFALYGCSVFSLWIYFLVSLMSSVPCVFRDSLQFPPFCHVCMFGSLSLLTHPSRCPMMLGCSFTKGPRELA